MIKIVRPDLDDLEFMGGSYELNQSNINYFEKKLGFNCLPVLGLYSPRCLPLLLYFSNVPWR
jgi:hypothetical protein